MTNLIKVFVLTLVLAVGGFAQIVTIDPPNASHRLVLDGVQTSEGTFNPVLEKTLGNAFVVNGVDNEYESTLLTISFDFDGVADWNAGNTISGGTWNLAMYTKDGYRGSIFGVVTSGQISWIPGWEGRKTHRQTNAMSSRNTNAVMIVTGGTGDYVETEIGTEVYLEGVSNMSDGTSVMAVKGFQY